MQAAFLCDVFVLQKNRGDGKVRVYHDSGILYIVFALTLVAWIIWWMWRRRQDREICVPITRQRLLWIGCIQRYLWAVFIALGLFILLGLMYLMGGISLGALVASLCFMIVVLSAILLEPILMLYRCSFALRSKMAPLPVKGKLCRQNGYWKYSDADWYISLGDDRCAMLYAPLIDFEKTVQMYTNVVKFEPRSKMYLFSGRDNCSIYALHPVNEDFTAWIQAHQYHPLYKQEKAR